MMKEWSEKWAKEQRQSRVKRERTEVNRNETNFLRSSFSFLFLFSFAFLSMKWNVSEIKAKEKKKKEKRTNGTKELNLSEKNKARFTKLPLSCVLFHFKFSSLFLSLHLITSQFTTTDWPQPFSSLVRFVLPLHYITNEPNKENDSGLAPTARKRHHSSPHKPLCRMEWEKSRSEKECVLLSFHFFHYHSFSLRFFSHFHSVTTARERHEINGVEFK